MQAFITQPIGPAPLAVPLGGSDPELRGPGSPVRRRTKLAAVLILAGVALAAVSPTVALAWGVGALATALAAVGMASRRAARRVRRIALTMRALARGDTHVEIPFTQDGDAIGEMSRALLVLRESLEGNVALVRELAESSRLASLGALVAGMAHELNTPIGNALSVSTALSESLRCLDDEAASGRLRRSSLDDFLRRGRDASSLIERNLLRASAQIGSFKQIAVDQTGDQRRTFLLDGALKDVVESMRPSARRAHCQIELQAEPGLELDGYPGALTQVVCNLIENAMKHGLAETSGGKISVRARRRDARSCEIEVADDGVGIPEELQGKIFDAFFTTRAGKGGSGLGLHIVNTLVSGVLGGDVSVDSRPGAGARFTIVLPNIAPEREDAEEPVKDRTYYAAA